MQKNKITYINILNNISLFNIRFSILYFTYKKTLTLLNNYDKIKYILRKERWRKKIFAI